ncbi:hypothetical protein PG993_011370 [Apiospora rasikravindrae]|uniref:Uncharacterized protein n=1 Tax=Apiospora rasikravindrae TaxID=990691 RepID=A0ABR1SE17_9PEZI
MASGITLVSVVWCQIIRHFDIVVSCRVYFNCVHLLQAKGKKPDDGSMSDPMQRYLSGSPKDDPWNALHMEAKPKASKTTKNKTNGPKKEQYDNKD